MAGPPPAGTPGPGGVWGGSRRAAVPRVRTDGEGGGRAEGPQKQQGKPSSGQARQAEDIRGTRSITTCLPGTQQPALPPRPCQCGASLQTLCCAAFALPSPVASSGRSPLSPESLCPSPPFPRWVLAAGSGQAPVPPERGLPRPSRELPPQGPAGSRLFPATLPDTTSPQSHAVLDTRPNTLTLLCGTAADTKSGARDGSAAISAAGFVSSSHGTNPQRCPRRRLSPQRRLCRCRDALAQRQHRTVPAVPGVTTEVPRTGTQAPACRKRHGRAHLRPAASAHSPVGSVGWEGCSQAWTHKPSPEQAGRALRSRLARAGRWPCSRLAPAGSCQPDAALHRPGNGGSAPQSAPGSCRSPAANCPAAAGLTRQQPCAGGQSWGCPRPQQLVAARLPHPRGSGKGRHRATSPRVPCRTSSGNASTQLAQLGCASRGDAGREDTSQAEGHSRPPTPVVTELSQAVTASPCLLKSSVLLHLNGTLHALCAVPSFL